jgi:hypothetical protein
MVALVKSSARHTVAGRDMILLYPKRASSNSDAELELVADSGYQGLDKLHEKSQTPKKKPKRGQLTRDEKRANRELSRRRIVVENVIRSLRIFRIMLERYRNRRRRFSLRFNLIAGLYNFELSL